VTDILDYLGQDWAAALYHDKLRELRQRLASVITAEASKAGLGVRAIGATASGIVQDCVLDFVQRQALDFPH